MANKYIILDTETTGLEVQQGHRVIEIGAVLLNDRKKSTDHFHTYLNPSRLIDEEASKVHGITNEDLNSHHHITIHLNKSSIAIFSKSSIRSF